MSLTLGEKLRQAREDRGFTLSEVSEQTRISPLYLESIENDDYRILPGGIFNKGFVKSYAKFVGLNEQEALMDYTRLLDQQIAPQPDELRLYKPEVLTDDVTSQSMAPTIIIAAIILALMTGGILFLVNYLRQPAEPLATNTAAPPANTATGPPASPSPAESGVPDMATLKVEFKAVNQPVRVIATRDGERSDHFVAAGSTQLFEPKQSLTLNYNRWNAAAAQLSINGKPIALPSEPLPEATDKRRIEFTITQDNLAQIWTSGAISAQVPSVPPGDNTNTAAPAVNPTAPPRNLPPRSTPAANAANAAPANRPADTPRPTAATPRPAANQP
jgi:cytoskeleton protein RodZ